MHKVFNVYITCSFAFIEQLTVSCIRRVAGGYNVMSVFACFGIPIAFSMS